MGENMGCFIIHFSEEVVEVDFPRLDSFRYGVSEWVSKGGSEVVKMCG